MKRLLISVILAMVLVLAFGVPVFADTSQNVTVTATPAYIAISESQTTWTINGIDGPGYIEPDTIYYANPAGSDDTTAPSTTVLDAECYFTITNNGSVACDLTVNFPDHTGGDASTNSNLGTNDTTKFGAYTYWSGVAFASKVICKSSASSEAYDNLASSGSIKWGIQYESQSDAWSSGTNMTSTVVVSATLHS